MTKPSVLAAVVMAALGLCACGRAADEPSSSSSLPPDGACTTTAGQIAALYTGDVSSIAIDDDSVYVGSISDRSVFRVPNSGAKGSTLAMPTGASAFAVSGGALMFAGTNGLVSVPVPDDTSSRSYVASGDPVEAAAYDGKTLFVNGTNALRALPIDGSPAVITTLPTGTGETRLAIGAAGVYLTAWNGQSASVLLVPPGGGGFTDVADGLPYAFDLAVDDSHIYVAAAFMGGLVRVALDGTGLTTLTTSNVQTVALDANYIYYATDSAIMKMDKATLGTKVLASIDRKPDVLTVHGGNVYWGIASGGPLSGAITPGAVMTTCK
jgi:hypothetical protein